MDIVVTGLPVHQEQGPCYFPLNFQKEKGSQRGLGSDLGGGPEADRLIRSRDQLKVCLPRPHSCCPARIVC